jgi:hypothetical protein
MKISLLHQQEGQEGDKVERKREQEDGGRTDLGDRENQRGGKGGNTDLCCMHMFSTISLVMGQCTHG